MKFQLRVSKVLVTGGSSGIGLAIARALNAEGCHVCICGRDFNKLQKIKAEEDSDLLSILSWDIQDVSLAQEKFNEAALLCGGYLDGLVNSAGIFISQSKWSAWKETEEQWDTVFGTNLKANIFLIRRFSEYLSNSKRKGNIFVVSSICSKMINVLGSYAGSKIALNAMIRGKAKKLLPFDIVLNGINPGIVGPTGINAYRDNVKEQSIARMIRPDEIAKISLFMMSEEAKICCGTMIDADGGYYAAL